MFNLFVFFSCCSTCGSTRARQDIIARPSKLEWPPVSWPVELNINANFGEIVDQSGLPESHLNTRSRWGSGRVNNGTIQEAKSESNRWHCKVLAIGLGEWLTIHPSLSRQLHHHRLVLLDVRTADKPVALNKLTAAHIAAVVSPTSLNIRGHIFIARLAALFRSYIYLELWKCSSSIQGRSIIKAIGWKAPACLDHRQSTGVSYIYIYATWK